MADDDAPLRGAGALPFADGGVGMGDPSRVVLYEDMLARPPGKIADFTPEQEAAVQAFSEAARRGRRGGGRRTLKRKPTANVPKAASQEKPMVFRRFPVKQEKTADGNTLLPQRHVQDQSRPAAQRAGEAPDEGGGDRGGMGVPLSRVPRLRGKEQAPAKRRGRPPRQSASEPGSGAIQAKPAAFQVSLDYFRTAPLFEAQVEYGRLITNQEAIAQIIEGRRSRDAQVACRYCEKVFEAGRFYGHDAIETTPGIWQHIYTCENANCIQKFNDETYRLRMEQRNAR